MKRDACLETFKPLEKGESAVPVPVGFGMRHRFFPDQVEGDKAAGSAELHDGLFDPVPGCDQPPSDPVRQSGNEPRPGTHPSGKPPGQKGTEVFLDMTADLHGPGEGRQNVDQTKSAL